MKRLTFLTALFGIGAAKAQVSTTECNCLSVENCCGTTAIPLRRKSADEPRDEPRPGDRMRRVTAWYGKPANGECPVCGTMAEPFKPKPIDTTLGQPRSFRFKSVHGRIWIVDGTPLDSDTTPKSRTVTCAHCRVLFEQESEK